DSRAYRRNGSEGAICVIHHPLDTNQDISAAFSEKRWPWRWLRLAGLRLDLGDCRLLADLRCGNSGKLLQFDSLMGIGHDLVPCHRWHGAAGHAVHHLIVVIAHPDTAYEIARVADKPRVAISIGRAGFSRGGRVVKSRAPTGAV